MAELHSITGHALLTGPAAQLDSDTELPAQVLVAERVLGIERDYTGGRYEDDVKAALALQVSYQVHLEKDGLWRLSSTGRGSRSQTGRSNSEGLMPPTHPLAGKMLRDVPGVGGWNTLKSLR